MTFAGAGVLPDGTSPHSESSCRIHMQTDICGIMLSVCSVFMDLVDSIIHQTQNITTNYFYIDHTASLWLLHQILI